MWNYRHLSRIDFRIIPVILTLMLISLLIISATTSVINPGGIEDGFFSHYVKGQIKWFFAGSLVFIFFAGFDYHKLREWTWGLYILVIVALIGLFFVGSIQSVHRWYRIPIINVSIQPSEVAKLIVIMSISWLLEKRQHQSKTWKTAFLALVTVGIPFLLILKQPDLGTAMVLYPIILGLFYFGNLNPTVFKTMLIVGVLMLTFILMIFLGVIPFEKIQPYANLVIKEYQVERLDPSSHHQKASITAIAIGGIKGRGWKNNEFSGRGWLPANYTDSVFSSYCELFGLVGVLILMGLFYALIYFGFKSTASAKDHFGKLLSAGISIYLIMHVLFNIGMMCGLLPITGVPLILISYGGSSIFATMAALGIQQNIYSRRFMF